MKSWEIPEISCWQDEVETQLGVEGETQGGTFSLNSSSYQMFISNNIQRSLMGLLSVFMVPR